MTGWAAVAAKDPASKGPASAAAAPKGAAGAGGGGLVRAGSGKAGGGAGSGGVGSESRPPPSIKVSARIKEEIELLVAVVEGLQVRAGAGWSRAESVGCLHVVA